MSAGMFFVVNLSISGLLVWWGITRLKRVSNSICDGQVAMGLLAAGFIVWSLALLPFFMAKSWMLEENGPLTRLINPTLSNLCIIVIAEFIFTVVMIISLSYKTYKRFNNNTCTIFDICYNDKVLKDQYLSFNDFKALYPIWKETVDCIKVTESECYYKICKKINNWHSCYHEWQKIYFKTYLDYLKYRNFVRDLKNIEAHEMALKDAEKRNKADIEFLTLQQKLINKYNEKLAEELKSKSLSK